MVLLLFFPECILSLHYLDLMARSCLFSDSLPLHFVTSHTFLYPSPKSCLFPGFPLHERMILLVSFFSPSKSDDEILIFFFPLPQIVRTNRCPTCSYQTPPVRGLICLLFFSYPLFPSLNFLKISGAGHPGSIFRSLYSNAVLVPWVFLLFFFLFYLDYSQVRQS